MSVNFQEKSCQILVKDRKFGIYDAEDKTPAKIIEYNSDLCNARVTNEREVDILFTAIDNCIIINRPNGEMDNRCDAMLCYESNLFFIELKNKRDKWQAEGLSQIESTIKRLIDENPDYYFGFKKRKAIVANRKNRFPSFHESNAEQREYFSSKYKMRIQFEAEINIK